MLIPGMTAPDFNLSSTKGDIKLSDYKGKWVVLFFYPQDFSGVCSTEIPEFNKKLNDFKALDAEVLGANTDSVYSHEAWIKELGGIDYPLISDYNKTMAESYEILLKDAGIALRAAFIIDPEGKIRYSVVHEPAIGRNVDEILRVLAALQSGGACPVNWQKGQATL
jgi:peroxiredoxin (alkyl hydroperoxide reductase subunit C)